MSNVRSRLIGAGAALQASGTLAYSATLWGEEDPERRDSLISTTALGAGKWVHSNLAYSNVPRHCSSAVTPVCWPKEAIAGSGVQ